MEYITLVCPHCSRELEVSADTAGPEIECPFCTKQVVVPGLRSEASRDLSEEDAAALEQPLDPQYPSSTSAVSKPVFPLICLAISVLSFLALLSAFFVDYFETAQRIYWVSLVAALVATFLAIVSFPTYWRRRIGNPSLRFLHSVVLIAVYALLFLLTVYSITWQRTAELHGRLEKFPAGPRSPTVGLVALIVMVLIPLIWVRRSRPFFAGLSCLSLLLAAYVIFYTLAATELENPRASDHVRDVDSLTGLYQRVVSYCEEKGEYPGRPDIDKTDPEIERLKALGPSAVFNYVLWPAGHPEGHVGLPLSPNTVVAVQQEPIPRSHWITMLTPFPRFRSFGPPKPPPWEPYGSVYDQYSWRLHEDQNEVYGRVFGVPCSGPLRVSGDGSVSWPGGSLKHPALLGD